MPRNEASVELLDAGCKVSRFFAIAQNDKKNRKFDIRNQYEILQYQ
jgi:hypothetical protein